MNIAFVSYEFPPSVAIGGIGTYVWEASKMLAAAGHHVEVFSAGLICLEPAEAFGIKVHRVKADSREQFRSRVTPIFASRHRVCHFDLVESPEIGCEAALINHQFPELPLVCKLHTPSYLVHIFGRERPTLLERYRFRLGALRRGRWAGLNTVPYQRDLDPEWLFVSRADEIVAPSTSIALRLIDDWSLDSERTSIFPLPFRPDPALLNVSIQPRALTIGFLGRLEARKGVVELARAIPRILRSAPHLQFRFLGPSWPYRNGHMEDWIRTVCRAHLDRITFVGSVERGQLAYELGRCDIITLPSRWENFPYACWEVMAAGRAVIGSEAGGMSEVIQPNLSGLLVPPRSSSAIADAVLALVSDPFKVAKLGHGARERVLNYLSPDRILPLQLASYERALASAALRS
jgi:glycogen(starch) synthase